jgi:D-arabinose 1-dehydrogenase-like Zn-dependent alcohol dehydrogenase
MSRSKASVIRRGLPRWSTSDHHLSSRRAWIGGIAETQEMLDFCAEHGIVADIEMIDIQEIDHAYDRMQKSDVKYRFVIDNASLAA